MHIVGGNDGKEKPDFGFVIHVSCGLLWIIVHVWIILSPLAAQHALRFVMVQLLSRSYLHPIVRGMFVVLGGS